MRKKPLSTLGGFGLAAILSLGFGSQLASASEPEPLFSPAEQEQLTSFFDTFDVSEPARKRLLASAASGETWQSMDGAATPVSSELIERDGVSWALERFRDGSVRATGVGGATPEHGKVRGVNDCGYRAGKTGSFKNCNIYYWVGLVQSGFRANFTINRSGYDSISAVWAPSFTALGACSASVPTPAVVKAKESSTGKAVAGYTPSATMCVTGYTTTFPSYLHVGGNQATHVFQ